VEGGQPLGWGLSPRTQARCECGNKRKQEHAFQRALGTARAAWGLAAGPGRELLARGRQGMLWDAGYASSFAERISIAVMGDL